MLYGLQDPLPLVPPGCSADIPEAIQDFVLKGKAALVSVGIIRDSVLGSTFTFLMYQFKEIINGVKCMLA